MAETSLLAGLNRPTCGAGQSALRKGEKVQLPTRLRLEGHNIRQSTLDVRDNGLVHAGKEGLEIRYRLVKVGNEQGDDVGVDGVTISFNLVVHHCSSQSSKQPADTMEKVVVVLTRTLLRAILRSSPFRRCQSFLENRFEGLRQAE